MAQISNITLPNGTKYNLKGSVYTVIGTQTAATGSWTGNLTSLDALYDGLTIAYYLPYAGSGNATLELTLANGTSGAINCYYQGTTRLTTHYGAGSIIFLTYYSAGAINIAGTATTDARWIAGQNYADENNNLKQNNNTTNADYRVLLSYSANDTTETKQAYKSTKFKANPSTGVLTATTFSGAFSGSGASITSLNASNISNGTLSVDRLATSGATAGSYGDSAAQTPGYGSTFKVPYITVDAKGRVTGISEHTVKIPASDNTNTTYSAGTGLSLSSTTFNHSNSVTAGTAGTSSATSGKTLAVPYVTYDAQGHITATGTHTHTISGLDASAISSGTIDSARLPSYVDDVLEYAGLTNFPSTGESGKIYVAQDTNKTYRWSGSAYVVISETLAIGTTASTAAAGNHKHTASYTPAGSIAVNSAGSTTTVPNVTGVGSVPTTEDIACDDITAWSAGSAPTLGTAIAADDITAWSAGSLPTLGTAIAADDITAWSAGSVPSLTISNQTVITGTSVSGEVMSFTTATNGSASGWNAGSVPSLSYTARSIPNVTGVGSLPSLSYTARSIPNVTNVGSAPSLTYTARTVKSVKSVGSAPTLGTAITVKTGDASYKFTGTAATITTGTPT